MRGEEIPGERVPHRCVIDRVFDGMVAETWNRTDNLGVLQQMGVVPPNRWYDRGVVRF